MDVIDGIVVGAAAAAIGTIVAYKFLEGKTGPLVQSRQAYGYAPGNPNIGVVPVAYPEPLPSNLPPVQQNAPITEAAYNQGAFPYEPAFNTNGTENWEVLPQ